MGIIRDGWCNASVGRGMVTMGVKLIGFVEGCELVEGRGYGQVRGK